MFKTVISAYHCDNYDRNNVYNIVEKIIKSFINISDIIKPNSRILIKPNLLSAVTILPFTFVQIGSPNSSPSATLTAGAVCTIL